MYEVHKPKVLHFYPRSPCGERLHYDNYNLHCVEISIHALLAESDKMDANTVIQAISFLSTLSLRRATGARWLQRHRDRISIHALLAESDVPLLFIVYSITEISIHALLAESDLEQSASYNAALAFLSTLSLRRATARRALGFVDPDISIHALLAESDNGSVTTSDAENRFLSTLSLRRATIHLLS